MNHLTCNCHVERPLWRKSNGLPLWGRQHQFAKGLRSANSGLSSVSIWTVRRASSACMLRRNAGSGSNFANAIASASAAKSAFRELRRAWPMAIPRRVGVSGGGNETFVAIGLMERLNCAVLPELGHSFIGRMPMRRRSFGLRGGLGSRLAQAAREERQR